MSEAVPRNVDGFDWREEGTTADELADGMASLAIEPAGTGYLGACLFVLIFVGVELMAAGPTSGVMFLRSLLMWKGSNPSSWALTNRQRLDEHARGSMRSAEASASLAGGFLTSQLIDAYFVHYHTSYPFVHEPTFRAQLAEVIRRPDRRSWDLLFSTILAIGAWTLESDGTATDERLSSRVAALLEDSGIFESANLTLIQALVLLSNYSQKRNRPNTGWNFLGIAVRMAISLGLHREFPEWDLSLLQREMRRRVWWGLFIFESGASTTFGRTILLPDKDAIDIKMPSNILDEV